MPSTAVTAPFVASWRNAARPYIVALRSNVYLWDAQTLERLSVAEWIERLGPEA